MVDRVYDGGTLILELPMEEKIYLPHVFTFTHMSAKLMLLRLGLNYLYLEYGSNGLFLIGDQYKGSSVVKTIETINAHEMRDGVYH
jgi:hypothetical protein